MRKKADLPPPPILLQYVEFKSRARLPTEIEEQSAFFTCRWKSGNRGNVFAVFTSSLLGFWELGNRPVRPLCASFVPFVVAFAFGYERNEEWAPFQNQMLAPASAFSGVSR